MHNDVGTFIGSIKRNTFHILPAGAGVQRQDLPYLIHHPRLTNAAKTVFALHPVMKEG